MMNSWGCLLFTAVTGLTLVVSLPTNGNNETDCILTPELYHPNGPRILPCKKEIILQKGQNFTLKCQASTDIKFTQQDVPEEIIGDFSIKQRKVINENDINNHYEISLDLINVDRYAIGYYACKDSSVKDDVLNYLTKEPNNTELVSYIYIYVDGTDSLFAPMREVVMARSGYYVVECRPSTPEVDVKILLASQNKTPDYLYFSPKIGYLMKTCIKVAYTCQGQRDGYVPEGKNIRQQKTHPKPSVYGQNKNFLRGETFNLNCTVVYTPNTAHNLTWTYPNEYVKNTVIEYNNNAVASGGILYHNITVFNATEKHAGVYTCISQIHCGDKQAQYEKIFLAHPFINLSRGRQDEIIETPQNNFVMNVEIKSYPAVEFTYYKNGIEIKTTKNKTYEVGRRKWSGDAYIGVLKTSVENSGNYTFVATNGNLTRNITYDLRFITAPVILNNENNEKTCAIETIVSLECEVTGYPLPRVTWILTRNGSDPRELESQKSKSIEQSSVFKEKSFLDFKCNTAGEITCIATNSQSEAKKSWGLIVHEVSNGFGILNPSSNKSALKNAWFPEKDNVIIKCLASKHDYESVTWVKAPHGDISEMTESSDNDFSLVAKLIIYPISLKHTGTYVCHGITWNGTVKEDSVYIDVAALQPPTVNFDSDTNGNVQKFQEVKMNCIAQGVPLPIVTWLKDDEPLTKNGSLEIFRHTLNLTTLSTSITIDRIMEEHIGTYACVARSKAGEVKKTFTLALINVSSTSYTSYFVVIGVIVFVFVILLIYLTWKIKKEKQFRKQLAAAGLLYFKEGVTKSINPELGIDEQAELLPYDEKFEFPWEKLSLGKQLGAGAFGVVYKAEARGIINAEQSTPVAVKMVKKTADNMYIKALASELKIMVHLGKHINIVNLLGACTKNIGKRELMVIVEYCKFGNIHNYMQRHREVFINQFSDNNKDMSFGKVNRGYDTSGSTGVQSDYGTANTQDTDHTFLTNNTNRTCRKISEGYVQPEWRCNYESDYSYDERSPRPLTSRDLLAWAFQIARGMEYLASRRVLHGDLAARNILLADDNIVKICDFGLARSIYKNDEYKKKENSPLPVKWLAIECISDSIFSTQSDVWSFGVVLWELFSLAKTPYPNIDPRNILQFLTEGHRLDKPAYSDDRIYNLMNRCWEQKPTVRPSFTQLQEILGTFLEDNVRNHYVDLNSAYMDLNPKPGDQEDYLAMMCAPDYNNQVTPSPHHYVNGINNARSFFPNPPTKIDEEGYLQMSPTSSHDIFSPKPTDTKFDFDPRNFNSRPSVASSGGSELTPMLTLNNLPRSGSDSDHEGNASPYLNVCPRIDEETDEVFETKLYNAKNAQNTAVSNPTYITFDIDVEKKKPIDINSYVNIVPNGLVK